ncbi:MAG: hypothetical protein PF542_05055 [Nanoarchaeota archaeon]|jgi:c-di-AMP phosphodiesterase-like protein|nr:hypothetical protein [Nanoarchaeota archaeon]
MTISKRIKIAQLLMIMIWALLFVGIMLFTNLTNNQNLLIAFGILFLCAFFLALIRRQSFLRRPLNSRIKKIKKSSIERISIREDTHTPIKVAKSESPKKEISSTQAKYIGSTETKTYHLQNCRFSKLIKPKFRVKEDTRAYFNKNKFKACKVCKADKN